MMQNALHTGSFQVHQGCQGWLLWGMQGLWCDGRAGSWESMSNAASLDNLIAQV